MNCPNCQTRNPDEARFCMNCGSALEIRCPNCSTVLPGDAKFCFQCGQPLGSPQSPERVQTVGQEAGAIPSLQRYIPKDLLSRFEAARLSGGMRGERRVVTILFCDIVGSTAAAQRMDPEDWTEIANGAFEHLIPPVYRYEGMVGRLMGDAILAFFGAPIAHEDDPERAVLAGLEILEEIRAFNRRIETEFGLALDVRIGINTGPVVIGEVGSDLRVEYTAMGDAVNLAARMEQTAQPGSLQISENTYRLVARLFETEDIGEIEVKGRDQPVQAYRVIGRREEPERLRGLVGMEAPLLGREAELGVLQNVLEGLSRGQGHIVSILGEAGLGKSRLVSEIRRVPRHDREDLEDILWLESRSLSYKKSIPLITIRYLVDGWVKSPSGQTDEQNHAWLKKQISEIAPEEELWITPFIGSVLGLRPESEEADPTQNLEPQQLRDSIFQAVRIFFRSLASRRPLVLVFDDLHWADASSLHLLERLAPLTDQVPTVILALFRPDTQEASWKFHEFAQREHHYNHTIISLAPLDASDSRDLVSGFLRAAILPEKLTDRILRKAEGNPFFIEEVIRSLLDSGLTATGDLQGQQGGEAREISVPNTLAGVLTTRLDKLGEGPKQVLQTAAVIGREFHHETLQGVLLNQNGLENALIELIRRDQIREVSRIPERVFTFKHVLTQEAAYNSLLRKERLAIHLRVAEWWEQHIPDQVYTIADHFFSGGQQARALPYLVEAGERSAKSYSVEEAYSLFSRAAEIIQSGGGRPLAVRLYSGMGEVLNWMGRHPEAVEAYEAMFEAAEASGDIGAQAAACHGISESQMQRGEPRAALESAQREEEIARRAGLELDLAKALWMKAWGLMRVGQVTEALEIAPEVLRLSERAGDRGQVAHSFNLQGVLYLISGEYTQAAEKFQQALDIFRELGNRRRAMPVLNNLGVIAEARGDFHPALKQYQEALDIAREIDNRNGEVVYLSNLGSAQAGLEDYQAAEENLRRAISLTGEAGSYVLSSTYSRLAEALVGPGKGGDALEFARQALDLGSQNESQEDIALAWRALGLVAAQEGRPLKLEEIGGDLASAYSADNCFSRSEGIYRQVGREEERARTLRAWAKYELAQGDRLAGERMWREAREVFQRLGAEPEARAMENLPH